MTTQVNIPNPYSAYLPATVLSVFPEQTSQSDPTSKVFLAGARSIVRYNARFIQDSFRGRLSKESTEGIKGEQFGQATWNDILDAASVLDQMDGGFTLILRCSGWSSAQDPAHPVPLEVYVPLREIRRHRREIEQPILQIVRVFSQDIAIPHLRRLSPDRGTVIAFERGHPLNYGSAIPPAVEMGSPHFRFFTQCGDQSDLIPGDDGARQLRGSVPARVLQASLNPSEPGSRANADLMAASDDPTSSIMRSTPSMQSVAISTASSVTLHSNITTRRNRAAAIAEAFTEERLSAEPPRTGAHPCPPSENFASAEEASQTSDPAAEISTETSSAKFSPNAAPALRADLPLGIILSLGPRSDAIIDTLGLSDTLIPRLRLLVESTRENKWALVLQGPGYGLDAAAAFAISDALKIDLASTPAVINKKLSYRPGFRVLFEHSPLRQAYSFKGKLCLLTWLSKKMGIRFYTTKARTYNRVRGTKTRAPRVSLSKEARRVLRTRRRQDAASFQTDIDQATDDMDETIRQIAVRHRKSFRSVQFLLHRGRGKLTRGHRTKTSAWNAWCWKKGQAKDGQGKGALVDIATSTGSEYDALTVEEKEALVAEFEEYKAGEATGTRTSNRSKVNDVTYTVGMVEKELENLRLRTGVEALLFLARGTTNFALNGVSFATEGVTDFMSTTMKIDEQDFVNRLEGYALNGLKGAAQNCKQRLSSIRTETRLLINSKLAEAIGVSKAEMKWKYYWRDIMRLHLVIIDGWPEDIPFGNLSEVATSMPKLESLLRKWKNDTTYFRKLTQVEFEELDEERNRQIEDGEIEVPTRKSRADKGKKRARTEKENQPPAKRRRGEFIEGEADDE